jgi:hypothetical protein
MKKSIQITVEKKILLKARAKALKKETVISHVIQGFLKLWINEQIPDPEVLQKLHDEGMELPE